MAGDLFHENWRHEQRADGLYVIIEEIGGLGALGPFPDAEAARIGFARYFLGLDLAPPSASVLPKAGEAIASDRELYDPSAETTGYGTRDAPVR